MESTLGPGFTKVSRGNSQKERVKGDGMEEVEIEILCKRDKRV